MESNQNKATGKKLRSRGHPMGSQEVGVLMYCYYINRPPSQTPTGWPPDFNIFFCGIILIRHQSFIKIKSLSQFLVHVLGETPFWPPFTKRWLLHKVSMPVAAWIFKQFQKKITGKYYIPIWSLCGENTKFWQFFYS